MHEQPLHEGVERFRVAAETPLVVESDCGQDAFEVALVLLFNRFHRLVDGFSPIFGNLEQLRPAGRLRHVVAPSAVFVRVLGELFGLFTRFPRTHIFVDDLLTPLVEDITESLEEQQAENVVLKIRSVGRASEDVRCSPQQTVKFVPWTMRSFCLLLFVTLPPWIQQLRNGDLVN